MKIIRQLFVVSCPLFAGLVLCWLGTGCATPVQRQEVVSTIFAVSSAGIRAYVTVAAEKCRGEPDCLADIERKFAIYTNALQAAQTAYAAYEATGTNRPVLLNLLTALTAAETDVTRAVLAAQRR